MLRAAVRAVCNRSKTIAAVCPRHYKPITPAVAQRSLARTYNYSKLFSPYNPVVIDWAYSGAKMNKKQQKAEIELRNLEKDIYQLKEYMMNQKKKLSSIISLNTYVESNPEIYVEKELRNIGNNIDQMKEHIMEKKKQLDVMIAKYDILVVQLSS